MSEKESFDMNRELEELGISTSTPKPDSDMGDSQTNKLAPEEIGRVAITDQLFISTTEHKLEVYIPEERRNTVDVGGYVVIPLGYRDEKIFGYIKKLSYIKRDAIDDMSEVHVLISADNVGEDEYIELAQVDPLSIITSAGKPVEVRSIPKPNTIVREVMTRDDVILGLDLREGGLFMG